MLSALKSSRKVKPYYANGDHCLFADIVADLTPFQMLRPIDLYDNITVGHWAIKVGVDVAHNTINVGRITAFAAKCEAHWIEKANFAERFMTASQKKGILNVMQGMPKH